MESEGGISFSSERLFCHLTRLLLSLLGVMFQEGREEGEEGEEEGKEEEEREEARPLRLPAIPGRGRGPQGEGGQGAS
jgi:hypothetical protein